MRWTLFSLFFVTLIQLIKSDGCNDTKPDFSAPGRRISEQKCHEYNWEITQLDKCSKDAANTEYPYMGSLGYRKRDKLSFLCGAFLISPKFALTAGHCINVPASTSLSTPEIIRFGNKNLDDNEPHVDAKIRSTIVHADYKPPAKENDIALVELESALPFTNSINPACLWSQAILAGEEKIFYPGWIYKLQAGKNNIITEFEIKVIEPKICVQLLKKHNIIKLKDSQICANESISGVPDGTMILSGGGPAIRQVNLNGNREDQMPFAVGVSSFGDRFGIFGIYTSIYSFIDWIEQTVWK